MGDGLGDPLAAQAPDEEPEPHKGDSANDDALKREAALRRKPPPVHTELFDQRREFLTRTPPCPQLAVWARCSASSRRASSRTSGTAPSRASVAASRPPARCRAVITVTKARSTGGPALP